MYFSSTFHHFYRDKIGLKWALLFFSLKKPNNNIRIYRYIYYIYRIYSEFDRTKKSQFSFFKHKKILKSLGDVVDAIVIFISISDLFVIKH